MTVQELIDALERFNPKTEIRLEFANGNSQWHLALVEPDEDEGTIVLYGQTKA